MDTDRWRRIGEVFEAVSGLEDEALERALDEHCGEDADLRREVVSLLEADTDAEAWLAGLTARSGIPAPEAEAVLNAPGRTIGAWRLVRQLGRGGMGVVYLAERADEQFQMQAALKALPVGLVTREAVARFQREREILAQLDHPHIARLLDGGVTPEGTPFYVMEYVEGLSLHRYCQEHAPGLDARIRLFEQIASAVAYAHRHLVIHRDIKPANILVTRDGVPKLLDFGVAKLVDVEAPDTATATQVARRRITPAYTAPELLQGEPVTTACDVYSLGVVLYELLAGTPPFEPGFFDAAGWTDRLAEYRPPPPSKAAGDIDLKSQLAGDLDTIVAMAMHPDPARRYATVNALLKDLERHRKRLPVAARPDTLSYRASRFMRRHAVGVAFTSLAALTLIIGTTVSLWQANRAAEAAVEARQQTQRALAAQRYAEQARARAESTRDFLVELFQATVPDVPPDEMPDTESLLAAGAERVMNAKGLDPVLRADMLTAIGDIYRVRGRHDEAEPLLDQARELAADSRKDAPEVYARTLIAWSTLRSDTRRHEEAIENLEELVGFLEEHAPDSAIALEARYELGWQLALIREDAKSLEIIQAVDRAVRGREDVTDRFRRDLKTGLANVLFVNGRYADAGSLYTEAIRIEEALKGPHHREVAVKLANAANNDTMLGRFDRANERYERALRIHHEIAEEPSQTHAAAHGNYASSLIWQGKVDKALEQQRKGTRQWSEYLGLESPEEYVLKDYRIAAILVHVGRWKEAKPYLERALADLEAADAYVFLQLMTLRALAQERCIAGDSEAGNDYLERMRAARQDREFLPWIQANILEAEAHCHHASGNLEAGLQTLDDAAEMADEMAPGAVADRARRALLRARLYTDMGDMSSAVSAIDYAQQSLEAARLDAHPVMTQIHEYRKRTLSGQSGSPSR